MVAPLYRIVLTGGPCGGKSTALAHITERLQNFRFNVYCVPEAATLLIMGGAKPFTMPPEQAFHFQEALMGVLFSLEDALVAIARASGKPSVVVCDRGAMDASAYMEPNAWAALLDSHGWTTVDLRDRRYEAVIHLATAAEGAEQHYTTANNAARTETPEQARRLDARIRDAWIGHPHLRVIDNSTDFPGKVARAVAAVCGVTGVPEPRARERKFLVRTAPEESDFPVRSVVVEIEQTYLVSPDGGEARVRKRSQQGSSTYTLTTKRPAGVGERVEVERMISGREYLSLLRQADPACVPVRKRRRVFLWNGNYFELDTFVSPAAGFSVLEVELDDLAAPVELPPFLDIGPELTGDERYSNRGIAAAGGVPEERGGDSA